MRDEFFHEILSISTSTKSIYVGKRGSCYKVVNGKCDSGVCYSSSVRKYKTRKEAIEEAVKALCE